MVKRIMSAAAASLPWLYPGAALAEHEPSREFFGSQRRSRLAGRSTLFDGTVWRSGDCCRGCADASASARSSAGR
jgi:hypothetical protein